MKKSLKLAVLSACAVLGALSATSCATPFPLGCLYTDVVLPGTVGDGNLSQSYNRRGSSSCYSILGWVAGGDASINEAAVNGGIDKIAWTNTHVTNYFGIYGIYKTEVFGTGKSLGPDQTLAPAKNAQKEVTVSA